MGSHLRVKMTKELASRRGALKQGKRRHETGRRIREWPGRRHHPGYSQSGRTLPSSRMGMWPCAWNISLLVYLRRTLGAPQNPPRAAIRSNASAWLIGAPTAGAPESVAFAVDTNVDCAWRKEKLVHACSDPSGKRKRLRVCVRLDSLKPPASTRHLVVHCTRPFKS